MISAIYNFFRHRNENRHARRLASRARAMIFFGRPVIESRCHQVDVSVHNAKFICSACKNVCDVRNG